jgi:hypothetical protein
MQIIGCSSDRAFAHDVTAAMLVFFHGRLLSWSMCIKKSIAFQIYIKHNAVFY